MNDPLQGFTRFFQISNSYFQIAFLKKSSKIIRIHYHPNFSSVQFRSLMTLHKKWSFPLRISSVNVAIFIGEIFHGKLHFLCGVIINKILKTVVVISNYLQFVNVIYRDTVVKLWKHPSQHWSAYQCLKNIWCSKLRFIIKWKIMSDGKFILQNTFKSE